jgi:hypothetical protein
MGVMRRVYSLNQQEIELTDHMVEFIWENDLIIIKSFTRFLVVSIVKQKSIFKEIAERFRFCFNDKNKDFKARSCFNDYAKSYKIHASV